MSDTSVTPHASSIGGDLLARLADFGLVLLREWWNDGSPGDLDGADVQDMAEAADLWRAVKEGEHSEDCEACGGAGGCGELTEAGLTAVRELERRQRRG